MSLLNVPNNDKFFRCHSCQKTFAFEYFHDLGKTHRCYELTSIKIPSLLKPKFKEVFQKCEYFCRICPEEYYSREDIVRHIKKAHPVLVRRSESKWGQYTYKVKATYGKLITKEVRHNCHLCRRDVMHYQDAITRHLKDFHGVDLITYYNNFFMCKREGT